MKLGDVNFYLIIPIIEGMDKIQILKRGEIVFKEYV